MSKAKFAAVLIFMVFSVVIAAGVCFQSYLSKIENEHRLLKDRLDNKEDILDGFNKEIERQLKGKEGSKDIVEVKFYYIYDSLEARFNRVVLSSQTIELIYLRNQLRQ